MKFSTIFAAATSLAAAAPALAIPGYELTTTVALGAPDRWDYVIFDAPTSRVYVAHGDRVTVVSSAHPAVVGQIEGIPGGTHGIAISKATGQGFSDDGKAGEAVAFDLKTLKVTKTIAANQDADAIASDAKSGHIFVIEGDPAAITVIDPKTDTGVATIKVGEKLEYGVGDDHGSIYVAGEEKGDLVRIDARTNAVVAHYPAPGCTSPHGLAIDKLHRRLFMGCANSVMPMFDADSGRVLAMLPIGRGNDAVAFDPVRGRVFSSNGVDGTVSVFARNRAGQYEAMAPIETKVSGRTMAIDPATGRLFVAAADTDPSPTVGGRPKPRTGTLSLLVFSPKG